MSDEEDVRKQSEQNIAQAIEALKRDMPTNFILIYRDGEEDRIYSHCSLNSARELLDFGIKAVAEQYAKRVAAQTVKG